MAKKIEVDTKKGKIIISVCESTGAVNISGASSLKTKIFEYFDDSSKKQPHEIIMELSNGLARYSLSSHDGFINVGASKEGNKLCVVAAPVNKSAVRESDKGAVYCEVELTKHQN